MDTYQVVDVCLALLIFSLTTYGLFYFLTLIVFSVIRSESCVMLFIFTSYDMLCVLSLSTWLLCHVYMHVFR